MKKSLIILLVSFLPVFVLAQKKKMARPVKKPVVYNVTFESNVPTAALFIDGNYKCMIVEGCSLKAGRYPIRLVADGYYEITDTINVKATSTNFKYEMQVIEKTLSLCDMLYTAMGLDDVNIFTNNLGVIMNRLSNLYQIDDKSDESHYSYFIDMFDNAPKVIRYRNWDLDTYTFMEDKNNMERTSIYRFSFSKTNYPTLDGMYGVLDEIVKEFEKLGFKLSYTKYDNEWSKAGGRVDINSNTFANLSLYDSLAGDIWVVSISISINSPYR